MKQNLSRRSMMAGTLLAPAAVVGQRPTPQPPKGLPKGGAPAKVWSNEYWAQKGEVKLYMFRKRATAPKAGEKPLPVLLLIHGSSNSGRSSFDLATPGRGEYS